MYLKKPLWSERITPNPSPESDPPPQSTAIGDLVNSLTQQRVYGEVTLALRTGLRYVSAEFSFLSVRGLCNLVKFLRNVAESDSAINFFSQTQSIPELQVVPVLFQHLLKDAGDEVVRNLDYIFGVDPLKITSPSSDSEVSLAIQVLKGCSLLHPESAMLAHQYKAIQVVMNILPTRVIEQSTCLDALIAIMLDSSANQMDFEAFRGIEEVAELIRDKQVDENLSYLHDVIYITSFVQIMSIISGKCWYTCLLLGVESTEDIMAPSDQGKVHVKGGQSKQKARKGHGYVFL